MHLSSIVALTRVYRRRAQVGFEASLDLAPKDGFLVSWLLSVFLSFGSKSSIDRLVLDPSNPGSQQCGLSTSRPWFNLSIGFMRTCCPDSIYKKTVGESGVNHRTLPRSHLGPPVESTGVHGCFLPPLACCFRMIVAHHPTAVYKYA